MSQTDDDRAWWEERRRLEVAQWRAWALELLRIPPDEADEPTSESLRAAIANRLRLTRRYSRLGQSPLRRRLSVTRAFKPLGPISDPLL